MTDNIATRRIHKSALWISGVFSPLLIPTYCMTLAMWVTILNHVPEKSRLIATFVVLFITALIPLGIIIGLMRAGRVSDLDITNHRQRLLPVFAISLCYVFASIYVWRLKAPVWLVMFFFSGFVTAIITAFISVKWKISGHTGGMGVLVGLMARLMADGLTDFNFLPWISVAVLLAGVVGCARIILDRHTVAQVYAGFLLGLLSTWIIMGIHPQFLTHTTLPV
jgi:membrane-associated phospholipid phosphatase